MSKVLVLLSGGLDSATVLAMLRDNERHAVGFDYGQTHSIELKSAERIANKEGVPFEKLQIPFMPRVNDVVFAGRNAVLASVAAGIAQARGFNAIALGCNMSDWARFPDCRPQFWAQLGNAIKDGYGVKVLTPLIHYMKSDVVEHAKRLGVDVADTWSCYAPTQDGTPCGECLACETRIKAGA